VIGLQEKRGGSRVGGAGGPHSLHELPLRVTPVGKGILYWREDRRVSRRLRATGGCVVEGGFEALTRIVALLYGRAKNIDNVIRKHTGHR
jgi:hypothetical protein